MKYRYFATIFCTICIPELLRHTIYFKNNFDHQVTYEEKTFSSEIKSTRWHISIPIRWRSFFFLHKRKSWWSCWRLLSLALIIFVYFFFWKVDIKFDYVEYLNICDDILLRSSSILYDWMSFSFLNIHLVDWSTMKKKKKTLNNQ